MICMQPFPRSAAWHGGAQTAMTAQNGTGTIHWEARAILLMCRKRKEKKGTPTRWMVKTKREGIEKENEETTREKQAQHRRRKEKRQRRSVSRERKRCTVEKAEIQNARWKPTDGSTYRRMHAGTQASGLLVA